MYCENCGKYLRDDDVYCENCGTKNRGYSPEHVNNNQAGTGLVPAFRSISTLSVF